MEINKDIIQNEIIRPTVTRRIGIAITDFFMFIFLFLYTFYRKKEVLNIPRFTSAEKKEFDQIEEVIEQIENKIKELKNLQQEYATDYQKLIEIDNQIKELEIELEHKLERWEYLNEINEQIIEYRNNKYK
mgnify:CR=1 FL=1